MNKAIPEEIGSSKGDRRGVVMSPYATGGGGVTFERKVAVQYLAHLLVGDGAIELGEGRCVERVFFQQAPDHPVDDLVVCAADINSEIQPLLMLGIAIRRMPKIVKSDVKAQKLIREFVRAMVHAPTDGREYRWSLVVAGPQEHARQIADLAGHARVQLDAPGFFADIGAPGKFSHAIRQRLNHLESLVERALTELNVAEVDPGLVQRHTWQLLAHLTVSMPRLESPDETDWSAVSNSLVPVARGGDIAGACQLRDRLLALASKYAPMAARVDRNKLRRDVHPLIELNTRRNERRWQYLVRLNGLAVKAVRAEIRDDGGARRMTLNRNDCTGKLVAKAADAPAVVVSGEPGVGKSALVLLGFSLVNEANPDNRQALVFNLRDVPKRPFKFECLLGCPLFTLLGELSAPQRTLIVDGADAVSEGRECTFRYLIDAAQKSDVKVVAITSCDGNQVVQDILKEHFGENVTEFVVPPLTDAEIDGVVETFTELRKLNANPRSRDLLRRLVVIDLLVRSGISGILLSDADAMREVWSRLVRQHGKRVRGTPDAREATLLKLADLALREVGDDERLNGINELDPTALDGLCRDGLLRKSLDNPFMIGLEFTHDEVRRYAVARLLLANRKPTEKLIAAGVPRWAFSAALLACQVLLEEDESPNWPLRGRFSRLQASFDALAEKGHIARWADVPGEALLTIANPGPVLQDAWSDLRDNDANGLKRLARLMDQRLRKKNGIVDIHSVEPIVELLLEDAFPWRMGTYAQDILRDWLHALVEANTAVGHSLRIRLRERLVDWCAKADHRLAEVQARASNPTSEEIEQRHVIRKKYPPSPLTFRNSRQKRPDIPIEITAPLILELLALLGPDLGSDGESILCRVAQGDPSMLAPAIEKLFTDRALTKYGQGLLAYLTEAYYLNDATDGDNRYENGVRRHDSRIVGAFPNYSWHFGPFFCMFMTDFRVGVAVLNRLLNHAAHVRVQKLAVLHGNVDLYQTELRITGERRLYLGDGHVWRWYRGYAVGPYPCFSALRALERVCDLRVKDDAAIGEIVSILLDRCENLAMVGLVVGLLIRHVEDAGSLLDSYFTEPIIWEQEFVRCAREFPGNEIDTDVVVSPERRMWSLREAAIFMTVRANAERAAELHTLGERLVENAQQRFKSARISEAANSPSGGIESNEEQLVRVRVWASSLDRTRLRVQVVSGGLDVTALAPEDVVQTMQESNEIRCHRLDLMARHFTLNNQAPAKPFKTDELEADISTARLLLANRSPESAQSDWDLPAMVVANALEAHFLHGTSLSEEALVFAADTVIRIGQGEAEESSYECESTFFEIGAYRSAARALPLLRLVKCETQHP
ncbi:MAG: hypothetical protein OXI38_09075 [Bacteroidota bacterium]|nr:hypothetical protein [Bacteroidota bacterium]